MKRQPTPSREARRVAAEIRTAINGAVLRGIDVDRIALELRRHGYQVTDAEVLVRAERLQRRAVAVVKSAKRGIAMREGRGEAVPDEHRELLAKATAFLRACDQSLSGRAAA